MKINTRPLANAVEVPRLLLKELGIKVSDRTINKKLEEHPYFPSLMAVSDCFSEWHVPNVAFTISKDDYKSEELRFPFLAHIHTDGGLLFLIHKIDDGRVIYSDEKFKRKEISENSFLDSWSGVILWAETNKESGEEGYFGKQLIGKINELKLPMALLIASVSILLGINFIDRGLGYSLLFLVKLLGLGVSVLLLAHSVNANNPLIQNLCSLSKKNDCNAILKSEAAKATPWLTWSEVGFFYFAGGFLSLLFIPYSIGPLILLNILSLPYTIWSLSFQFSRKSWCVLCCAVQIILWCEFGVAFFTGMLTTLPGLSNFTFLSVSTTSICFIATVLFWYLLKPTLQNTAEHKLLKQQLKKFKYNSDLFDHALTMQPRYALPNDLSPIILGNREASTIITLVSNPLCGPCAKAHETLDQWINTRDDLQLNIIFAVSEDDEEQQSKVIRHLTALNLTNDKELVENALNHWYSQAEKKYEVWAKDYQIAIGEEVRSITKKQKQWCVIAKIAFTPTILINGYKLPEPYKLEDIQYLLD